MAAATANKTNFLSELKQKFDGFDTDKKLAILWYVYEGIGDARLEEPDENKEPDTSVDLYNKLKDKSNDEQLQFMRDVLSGNSNDATNEYQSLNNTTKVALWYRLGEGMAGDNVVPVPADYDLSDEAKALVEKVNDIDFDQRYIFMRDAILG